MGTILKLRRGTKAQHDNDEGFIGEEGELTLVTDTHELRIHDGVTLGGNKVVGDGSLSVNMSPLDDGSGKKGLFVNGNLIDMNELLDLQYDSAENTIVLNDEVIQLQQSSLESYATQEWVENELGLEELQDVVTIVATNNQTGNSTSVTSVDGQQLRTVVKENIKEVDTFDELDGMLESMSSEMANPYTQETPYRWVHGSSQLFKWKADGELNLDGTAKYPNGRWTSAATATIKTTLGMNAVGEAYIDPQDGDLIYDTATQKMKVYNSAVENGDGTTEPQWLNAVQSDIGTFSSLPDPLTTPHLHVRGQYDFGAVATNLAEGALYYYRQLTLQNPTYVTTWNTVFDAKYHPTSGTENATFKSFHNGVNWVDLTATEELEKYDQLKPDGVWKKVPQGFTDLDGTLPATAFAAGTIMASLVSATKIEASHIEAGTLTADTAFLGSVTAGVANLLTITTAQLKAVFDSTDYNWNDVVVSGSLKLDNLNASSDITSTNDWKEVTSYSTTGVPLTGTKFSDFGETEFGLGGATKLGRWHSGGKFMSSTQDALSLGVANTSNHEHSIAQGLLSSNGVALWVGQGEAWGHNDGLFPNHTDQATAADAPDSEVEGEDPEDPPSTWGNQTTGNIAERQVAIGSSKALLSGTNYQARPGYLGELSGAMPSTGVVLGAEGHAGWFAQYTDNTAGLTTLDPAPTASEVWLAHDTHPNLTINWGTRANNHNGIKVAQADLCTANGSYFKGLKSGQTPSTDASDYNIVWVAGADYAVETAGNMKCHTIWINGYANNFTGGHPALLPKDITPSQGDIMVDVEVVGSTDDINNALTLTKLSDASSQKGAVGVYTDTSTKVAEYPDSLIEKVDSEWKVKDEYQALCDANNLVLMNGVGEGRINVCGEGGNLEIGDLIVTSSIQGKGKKQGDDIIRSITVAKVRENISFSNSSEVKQVACIYLCG